MHLELGSLHFGIIIESSILVKIFNPNGTPWMPEQSFRFVLTMIRQSKI